MNYEDLNAVTRKDAYPIQNMRIVLDELRKAKHLSKIDLEQAYFQMMLSPDSL